MLNSWGASVLARRRGCSCRAPRWGPAVVPGSSPPLLSLQTAQAARRRSSKASPSWPWRSSGTSAASSAKRAGSSSPASTSASECRCPGGRLGRAGHCWAALPRAGAAPPLTRFSFLSQRDGVPYCESDYHAQFGIKCETCDRYISGRVLEVSPRATAASSQSVLGTACVLPRGACLGEELEFQHPAPLSCYPVSRGHGSSCGRCVDTV